jgi:hypothetical protein
MNMLKILRNGTTYIVIEHRISWRHNPQEWNLNIHRSHNLKSHMKVFITLAKDGTSFLRQTTSQTTISEYRWNIHGVPNYTAMA